MIEVENLTKRFGDNTVLDDISLSVAEGEILAVVGPSGAGKSTLSRCISFLERPTSGTIRADGKDFSTLDGQGLLDARRTIGTIFQAAPLLRRRTVAENVGLPLEYLGATKASLTVRVDELVRHVGLSERRDYFPSQLSGGQKQRVGIARALALAPSNLLADEATSGLDPATTESILDLLKALRDELGLSILLITHEMDVVRRVADSVARLEGGRIIESGPVNQVLLDPASDLSLELLPGQPTITPSRNGEIWEVSYASRDVHPTWLTGIAHAPGLDDLEVEVLSASIEAIRGIPVGRATLLVSPAAPPAFLRYLSDRGLHAKRAAPSKELAA